MLACGGNSDTSGDGDVGDVDSGDGGTATSGGSPGDGDGDGVAREHGVSVKSEGGLKSDNSDHDAC